MPAAAASSTVSASSDQVAAADGAGAVDDAGFGRARRLSIPGRGCPFGPAPLARDPGRGRPILPPGTRAEDATPSSDRTAEPPPSLGAASRRASSSGIP